MDETFRLWVLLHQARHLIFRARSRELSQYGITPEQAAVLFVIEAIDHKATAAEISRWLLREPHSISGILGRMEKEGLIRKVKNAEGNGQVNVWLTEEGRQAYTQSLKREPIREILSCLSEAERQQLGSCLEKLRSKAFENLNTVRKIPFP